MDVPVITNTMKHIIPDMMMSLVLIDGLIIMHVEFLV